MWTEIISGLKIPSFRLRSVWSICGIDSALAWKHYLRIKENHLKNKDGAMDDERNEEEDYDIK